MRKLFPTFNRNGVGGLAVCCIALASSVGSASLNGQDNAVRVGPARNASSRSVRVVEVQATTPVRASVSDAGSEKPSSAAPINVRAQLADAKGAVAERQLARISQFNRYAQPGAAHYSSSRVLPPAQGIRPTRTGEPVQMFQPGSTFSHVVRQAVENRQSAALEAAAEALRDQAKAEARSPEQIAADMAVNQKRLVNLDQRLQQLQGMSRATYSQLYQNLGDRLLLEIFEAQLERSRLLTEQQVGAGAAPTEVSSEISAARPFKSPGPNESRPADGGNQPAGGSE